MGLQYKFEREREKRERGLKAVVLGGKPLGSSFHFSKLLDSIKLGSDGLCNEVRPYMID